MADADTGGTGEEIELRELEESNLEEDENEDEETNLDEDEETNLDEDEETNLDEDEETNLDEDEETNLDEDEETNLDEDEETNLDEDEETNLDEDEETNLDEDEETNLDEDEETNLDEDEETNLDEDDENLEWDDSILVPSGSQGFSLDPYLGPQGGIPNVLRGLKRTITQDKKIFLKNALAVSLNKGDGTNSTTIFDNLELTNDLRSGKNNGAKYNKVKIIVMKDGRYEYSSSSDKKATQAIANSKQRLKKQKPNTQKPQLVTWKNNSKTSALRISRRRTPSRFSAASENG